VTKSVSVTLDTQPPAITIVTPTPGTLTRLATIDVSGTVADTSAVSVSVNGRTAIVSGGTFSLAALAIPEGDSTITARATDAAGRSTDASIIVTRDSTAPTIELAAPERITRRQPGQVVATVTDADTAAQVEFRIDGVSSGLQTAPPYTVALTAPAAAAIGDTITIAAIAT